MGRFVAFLRGINVGGHRVSMERLRALFEELRFANVSTFIASGNVLLQARADDPAALERRIERHLHKSLGYAVDTFLRTPAEIMAVATCEPFSGEDRDLGDCSLYVSFLRTSPADGISARLAELETDRDALHLKGRELYWRCRGKTLDSLLAWPQVQKLLGTPSTMRNMTTVRRLAARLE